MAHVLLWQLEKKRTAKKHSRREQQQYNTIIKRAMLIKEYRIPLPLTVEEYRIAQLYMIAVSKYLI